jgi:hypothetical protein
MKKVELERLVETQKKIIEQYGRVAKLSVMPPTIFRPALRERKLTYKERLTGWIR